METLHLLSRNCPLLLPSVRSQQTGQEVPTQAAMINWEGLETSFSLTVQAFPWKTTTQLSSNKTQNQNRYAIDRLIDYTEHVRMDCNNPHQ